MEHIEMNLPNEIETRVQKGLVSKKLSLAMLIMRTVLFFTIGFVMVGIFSLMGMDAWKAVVPW